mgnify:CR=1 FL=1
MFLRTQLFRLFVVVVVVVVGRFRFRSRYDLQICGCGLCNNACGLCVNFSCVDVLMLFCSFGCISARSETTTVIDVVERFVCVFVIHLGTIPSELGQLDRLQNLHLYKNQLSGP